MKSILLVGAFLFVSGISFGQIKVPKVKLNKPKIATPKVVTPKKEEKTKSNSLAPASESNRKRPGGTLNRQPAKKPVESKGTIPEGKGKQK